MYTTLQIKENNNYIIAQLDRGKANPVNWQMVDEIRQLLREVAENEAQKGLILTGKPHFFTAGVDIVELYYSDEEKVATFWRDFNLLIKEMTAFPKPLISAITGHSPAGGCIFAICSDYRIMAEGKYRIGLNEVPVGIIVPDTIFKLYSFWIGQRRAYHNLLEGKLLRPEEALEIGLVDEVVPLDKVLEQAMQKMDAYLQFDANTWQSSKANFRADLIKSLDIDFETVFAPMLQQWWSPQTQGILKAMVNALGK